MLVFMKIPAPASIQANITNMSIIGKFDLRGKTALVTGCKRGIGKAIALGLAEAGADIIGVSATLEPEGSAVEKEVNALGRKFKGYAADFADRAALYQFIATVKGDFPVIDILVNNAGHHPAGTCRRAFR